MNKNNEGKTTTEAGNTCGSGVMTGCIVPRKEVVGDCILYHGDCLEILPFLDGVDIVISDPPYGINLKNNDKSGHRRDASYRIDGDKSQEAGLYVLEWAGGIPTVFFASPWKPWPGKWRNLIVWDKGGAVGGGGDIKKCLKRTWELIQVANNGTMNGKREESVWRHPITPRDTALHICAKPVDLMTKIVNRFSCTGTTVLDPFMGSGTTGVACIRTGRKFIGIEKDATHFENALNRIKRESAQGRLF